MCENIFEVQIAQQEEEDIFSVVNCFFLLKDEQRERNESADKKKNILKFVIYSRSLLCGFCWMFVEYFMKLIVFEILFLFFYGGIWCG